MRGLPLRGQRCRHVTSQRSRKAGREGPNVRCAPKRRRHSTLAEVAGAEGDADPLQVYREKITAIYQHFNPSKAPASKSSRGDF